MEQKYYIFLGMDLEEDENCYLNYNIKNDSYNIDSKVEGMDVETRKVETITEFTKQQIEKIKSDLPKMEIRDEDLIPVTE